MSRQHFTSDWHAGELQAPHTHSYLRPRPTTAVIGMTLGQCVDVIEPGHTLCFVGDLGIQLTDLEVYRQLPRCRKVLVLGDKEYANKNFSRDQFMAKIQELGIFDEIVEDTTVTIGGIEYFVSHKPLDCIAKANGRPALCGHIHGIWRSAKMPNGQPIINVGIDAWGGLVSEEFIAHQHTAVTKHYDDNAFPAQWAGLAAKP